MATKSQTDQRRIDVETAIRGLYAMFPDTSSCRRTKTREAMEVEAQIAARKEELASDKQLAALQKKLDGIRKATIERIKDGRKRVDGLLRKFQLRGESEALLKDVEKIAGEEPVVFFDPDCC